MAKFEGKMVEIMERQMKHLMMAMWNTHPETMMTVQDPGMMQFAVEHQEVHREDDTVMPVGEPRKQCRVWKLATEHRQKMKKRTFRHATVAWRKRKLFRKTWAEKNCGQCKELAVAGMRMTRRARVAWRRENFIRKDWTRNQAEQGTPKPRKDWKRLWKGQEFNDGLSEGLGQQPQRNWNKGPRHKTATVS
jgi:hypothetical protein